MIISCNNIREIENINLHDAYIENVIYNHSNKVINVELESEWEKTDYDLSFHEVLRNGLAYGRALLQGFNRFIAGMAAGIIDEEQCVGRF